MVSADMQLEVVISLLLINKSGIALFGEMRIPDKSFLLCGRTERSEPLGEVGLFLYF